MPKFRATDDLLLVEADRLLPRLRGPPTRPRARNQCRFNRLAGVFGGEFGLDQAFKVHPAGLGGCDLTSAMTDNALAPSVPVFN